MHQYYQTRTFNDQPKSLKNNITPHTTGGDHPAETNMYDKSNVKGETIEYLPPLYAAPNIDY